MTSKTHTSKRTHSINVATGRSCAASYSLLFLAFLCCNAAACIISNSKIATVLYGDSPVMHSTSYYSSGSLETQV